MGEPQALGSGGWGEGTIKVKTQARTKVLIQILMTRNPWATSQSLRCNLQPQDLTGEG